mmetsp:Transcript_21960/g.33526  ORF Transcript_21960/g.33526 Transcript_21960/m.33526 type:complete len:284 (-) Transcript_21960:518-1369(-)|eukprot:CAMPEP_0196812542 /NCGR_PEP_ID=MMETSP1362-20130617/27781_1 /TAXON_ID=163516 /ORGANISM="Leptocylindrus danicus, Strain CCMP1856" /LENGTH=283 /DNA_ID=CAMNT_0042188269 /DNA_START=174 /DNA_END=1025 /DNA_ORIENTATION=+
MASSSNNKPRDGPATNFEPDPYAATLISVKSNDVVKFSNSGEKFGLVLVSAWRKFPIALKKPYEELKRHVQNCFRKDDFAPIDDTPPSVYLYPWDDLHVTVAAFHYNHAVDDEQHASQLTEHWRAVVQSAMKRDGWPAPGTMLQFNVQSAQIGTRNGILLWKELSGAMDAMRRCIEEEVLIRQQKQALSTADTVDTATIRIDYERTVSIPGIVHSTFLRFHRIPSTCGHEVQERFRENVLPFILNHSAFRHVEVSVDDIKFVCEKTPCMHIPDDSEHVLEGGV